ncbi:MAG TPA: alpha/beta hydrolase [Acidimicrobiales bacterium]|nr:alpha/beta hydrolase [Acidimicrobiales bacterium]
MNTDSYLTLPGTPELAYRTSHTPVGSPLVLLHGLSADSSSWGPVIERFSDSWRIYGLDFRGHGFSSHSSGSYRLADYVHDAQRLLEEIGEPAIVVGHSLGAIVAAALAQDLHPYVRSVVLEDPPLYVVEPLVFADHSLGRAFKVLREHVTRLQARQAPIDAYRELLAAAPHPSGDTQGDHLHPDALWSRARSLSLMDPDAMTAVLEGRTFEAYKPDRPFACPAMIMRAEPGYGAAFLPEHETRLRTAATQATIVPMPGSGHNIRGDMATRTRYVDVLAEFLAGKHIVPTG